MSYEVSIVADSVSPSGARVTTFQLKYPRFIHSEVMTHRAFSRNASSTRARPTAKLIEEVMTDPAMPVYWGKNRKGMQAGAELTEDEITHANCQWLQACDETVHRATVLMMLDAHKQVVGRILEPWSHIEVVLTGTCFNNFFALRCHPDAMPEIQVLAVRMARAYRDSLPTNLLVGEWHLPYVSTDEQAFYRSGHMSMALSVARCARVSYKTHDGKAPNYVADVQLHDRLRDNGHWSPFEHQARALAESGQYRRSGNFRGWEQYRNTLATSVHSSFDFATLDRFGERDFIIPA